VCFFQLTGEFLAANLQISSLLSNLFALYYNHKINFESNFRRNFMTIGENIARFRKEKGLTQAKLGEMVGVSNQAVSKWESGTTIPDVMLLPEISKALGITLTDLYGILNKELTEDDPETAKINVGEDQKILTICVKTNDADVKTKIPAAVVRSVFGNQLLRQYLSDDDGKSLSELLNMIDNDMMGTLVDVDTDECHVKISLEKYEN
jgi:transcriptional regulator with XRE-family HTH domain